MSAERLIELVLHGNASQAIGEMERLAGATDVAGSGMHAKLSSWAQKTTLAVAGMGIGIAAVSVKLADDFDKAHAQLVNSLENTKQKYSDVKGQIDQATKSGEKYGENQAEVEGLLAKGNAALGSNAKATQALQMAQDFSAKTGKDLATSYVLAEKALQGNSTALQKAGIYLPVVSGTVKQLATAQGQLTKANEAATLVEEKINDGRLKGQPAMDAQKKAYENLAAANQKVNDVQNAGANIADAWKQKFGGAADAAADTFPGKLKTLQASLENIGIKIGEAVIPVIEDLASALSSVIGWFEKNKTAAEALGIAIGTVLAAAVSIFVYDKIAAFVGGLQRMATGLGLMSAQATTTAAEVETSAASMDGAGVAAGGAGAAILPVVAVLGLAAGAAYGLYTAFNEAGISVDVNSQKLATMSTGALAQSITKLQDFGNKWGDASGANKAFNKVLDETPQFAQKFIDAANQAGISTQGFTNKLIEHQGAAQMAENAQKRWSLQLEIADAKARGDSASVYGLTLQLNAVPTDKQIQMTVHSEQAYAAAVALRNALDDIPRYIEVGVNVVGGAALQGAQQLARGGQQ